MAQKGIREYDAKRLIAKALPEYSNGAFRFEGRLALVSPETDLTALAEEKPWLKSERLVVKPDQLFGKRGKNNLLLLDVDFERACAWINERMNKELSLIHI